MLSASQPVKLLQSLFFPSVSVHFPGFPFQTTFWSFCVSVSMWTFFTKEQEWSDKKYFILKLDTSGCITAAFLHIYICIHLLFELFGYMPFLWLFFLSWSRLYSTAQHRMFVQWTRRELNLFNRHGTKEREREKGSERERACDSQTYVD